MSKFALLLSLLLLASPCLAQDKSDGKDAAPADKNAAPPGKRGGERGRERRDHPLSRHSVESLSSLDPKQKEQISAIYDGNRAQFESLGKQLRELRESEWAKVKAVLTPEQLTQLQQDRESHHEGHHGKGHHGGEGHKHGGTPGSASPDAAPKAPAGDSN